MSAECDQLRNEIQRLRQEIAGLDGRFMLVSERPTIYRYIEEAKEKADDAKLKAVNAGIKAVQAAANALDAAAAAGTAASTAGRALGIANAIAAAMQIIINEFRQFVIRERFNALENRVNAIEGNLNVLTRVLGVISNRVNEALRRLDQAELNIRVLFNNFFDLRNRLTNLLGRVVDLEQWRRYVDAFIVDALRRIEVLQRDVVAILMSLGLIDVRLTTLESLVKQLQQKVTDLVTRLGAVEGRLTTLESLVKQLQQKVTALVARLGAVEGRLTTLESLVKQLQQKVTDLVTRLGAVEGRLTTLESLVKQLQQKVTELVAKVALFGVRLGLLAIQLTLLGSRITSVDGRVTVLNGRVSSLILTISTLTVRLGLMTVRVSTLGAQVTSLGARVTILGARMAAIEQLLIEIKALLSGEVNGTVDLTPCNDSEQNIVEFSGRGLLGLYSAVSALARANTKIFEAVRCIPDSGLVGDETEENSWPVTVPALLTQEDNGDSIDINGLPQAIAWIAKNLDAVSGQYPIKIEIQDTDPLTSGDQSQVISLPNQAEAMAEIFGLAYESNMNSELAVNMLFRAIPEIIAAKNSSLTTQDYTQALVNWSGFRTKAVARKIDSNFNPLKADNMADFLSASKYEIQGVEDDDPHTLVEWVQQIKYAVAILKASVFRSPEQAENLLEEMKTVVDGQPQDSGESWEQFIDALNRANSNLTDRNFHPRPRAIEVDDVLNPGTIIPDRGNE